jgi:pyrimidine-specific ribonucleoside hydrolase
MGGGATKGNETAYAEFNFWQDPHAVSVVLNAGFSDLVLVDLDACDASAMTRDEVAKLGGVPLTNPLAPLLERFYQFYCTMVEDMADNPAFRDWSREHYVPYDAIAVAVAAFPEIAQYTACSVVCECNSSLSAGQMIIDRESRLGLPHNVRLAHDVDRDLFARIYLKCIEEFGRKRV